jgi:two-component system, OmpR family, phosphate regulon sensor histidine kinase PhoR
LEQRPLRVSLFWRSGLTFLALLLAVLLAVDLYATHVLRREALDAGFDKLEALARVGEASLPPLDHPPALRAWLSAMASSGAQFTLIASDGRVIADSVNDAEAAQNQADRPEFRQALSQGEGRTVRRNATPGRDFLYLALRHSLSPGMVSSAIPGQNSMIILRIALPLGQVGQTLAGIRFRFWAASLLLLFVAGGAALLVSRGVSTRIHRLKEFSHRVARGDFRPLEMESGGDELDDLARAFNETASRLAETIRVLTEERNRSAAILSSMIEGVLVISPQERIIFSNRPFSQILGLESMSMEGRPLVEVVRQPDLLTVVKKVLLEHQQVSSEVAVGTVRPRSFAVTAAPVRTEGASGAVLVLHEISELRRLERVRQDFVANVSHEFRTPLTAIQGFAETLLGGALEDPAHRRRFVQIIRDHAARLARLTEDLLKLSRIEAGRLELEFRTVSIHQIVESCAETARFKAAQKKLALEVRLPEDLPNVRGDSNGLHEVLQNLLDNALQYTPPGGRIEVSASREDDKVVVTVSDTGIGIPQAEQGRIFERFYRVDAARSREAGGTGLGLSIARHIVEAHGGRLWVESAVGEGSRFHFSIPAAG